MTLSSNVQNKFFQFDFKLFLDKKTKFFKLLNPTRFFYLILLFTLVNTAGQSSLQAQEYKINLSSIGPQDTTSGEVQSIESSYNSVTRKLFFKAVFIPNSSGTLPNGFVLSLLNNITVPTYSQIGVLYFDGSNPSNPVITGYSFNGTNYLSSWKYRFGILSADKIFSSIANPSYVYDSKLEDIGNMRILSFSIDSSIINTHIPLSNSGTPWIGTSFENKLGIELYPVSSVVSQYDSFGFLTKWQYSCLGKLSLSNILPTKYITDCKGDINGSAVLDVCAVCGGDGTSCNGPSISNFYTPTPGACECSINKPTATPVYTPTSLPPTATPKPVSTVSVNSNPTPLPALPTATPTQTKTAVVVPTIPASICGNKDITDLIFALDGGSHSLKNVASMVKNQLIKKDPSLKNFALTYLQQAEDLHIKGWASAWGFPQIVSECTLAVNCVVQDLSINRSDYKSDITNLKNVVRVMISKLKTFKDSRSQRSAKSFTALVNKYFKQATEALKLIPVSSTNCK